MPLFFALLPVALAAGPTQAQIQGTTSWKEIATKSGKEAGEIKVLQATIAGIECFRGEAQISVPAATLLSVALDAEGATKWSSNDVTEAKILGKTANTVDYFQYLDTPGWTFSADRFWILRANVVRSGETLSMRWDRMGEQGGDYKDFYADVMQRHPDAIEPPINVGGWSFTTQADGTLIHYDICTNAGGSIPAGLQTMATKNTLPDTVNDLVKEAKRRAG